MTTGEDFDYRKTAFKLLDCLRPMGLDRAFTVAFELTFLAWECESGARDFAEWQGLKQADPSALSDRLPANYGFRAIQGYAGALPAHALWDAFTTVEDCRAAVGADGLHELSETLLVRHFAGGKQGGAEYASPEWLAELIAALLGPAPTVIDPVCGVGSILLSMARRGARATGFDSNEEAINIAQARLRMAECDFQVRVCDSLQNAHGLPDQQDAVVMAPPLGVKPTTAELDGLRAAGLPGAFAKGMSTRGGLHWAALASSLLAPNGRAAVLLSPSASRASAALETLIELRMVEGVITLPAGSLPTTVVAGELWLLTAEGAGPSSVLVADASSFATQRTRRDVEIGPDAIEEVRTMVDSFRAGGQVDVPGYVARVVSLAERKPEDGLAPRRILEAVPSLKEMIPDPSGHLLSSLSVSGYKAFVDETEVPLGNLTLVYGPNSSGKSSLIQSLLLLKQSLDADHLVTQGPYCDVGSFTGIRNKHDAPSVGFGVTFGAPVWDLPTEGTPDPSQARFLGFEFSDSGEGRGRLGATRVEAGPLKTQWTPAIDKMRSAPLASLVHVFEELATGTFLFGRDTRHIVDDDDPDRDAKRRTNGRSQVRRLERSGMTDLQIEWAGLIPGGRPPRLPADVGEGRGLSTAQSYVDRLSRLVGGVGLELKTILDGLVYLGPLRSAPQRFYSRAAGSGHPGDGRDAFLFLYDNASSVQEVNDWFKKLEIPYAVDVVPVHAEAVPGLVGDLVAVSLQDLRSNVVVTPADVGYGISQAIPIVVELTARSHSIICIEQPETHLHPRLQARLGDLLIDATNPEGRANQLIVETHSEHLLLRVQRRIREDDIDAGNVCVLYVDQNEDGSARVQRLRLDEDGDFVDEWPDGFFDERMEELFGGLL